MLTRGVRKEFTRESVRLSGIQGLVSQQIPMPESEDANVV